uniref:Uncharacterized protein n=1 Tax=Knipowitschia caucasica TaxID=637954 RepID=A0AAV2LPK8_KNICA
MIGLDLWSPLKAGACSARAHESWPGCGGRTFGDRQLYLVGGCWSAWEKRFGFCREFGCSTIETLSCSWDKSGIHTGSPPPPTGRECVPFTGRLSPRVVYTRATTLKGSRCSVHLSRMSLETLERAHVWPPGSDHTAAACTSAGVL